MAASGHSPLDHVVDHATLEVPGLGTEIPLPWPLTRFMVMELIAALLVAAVMIPLARHASRNRVTRGKFFNLFEAMVQFIRNGIAKPTLGEHGADAFLPFLWTLFFFILFNNLLGMIPGGASATANINVTGVLALLTLGAVITAGVRELGPAGFVKNIVPHLDVPSWLKPALWPLMFVIEVTGLLIRHLVLAVRLFANMLAGHLVLAAILGLIALASGAFIYVVAPGCIAMVVGLSLLELFVAFLQAYIFTFLSALFIGAAVHPH